MQMKVWKPFRFSDKTNFIRFLGSWGMISFCFMSLALLEFTCFDYDLDDDVLMLRLELLWLMMVIIYWDLYDNLITFWYGEAFEYKIWASMNLFWRIPYLMGFLDMDYTICKSFQINFETVLSSYVNVINEHITVCICLCYGFYAYEQSFCIFELFFGVVFACKYQLIKLGFFVLMDYSAICGM